MKSCSPRFSLFVRMIRNGRYRNTLLIAYPIRRMNARPWPIPASPVSWFCSLTRRCSRLLPGGRAFAAPEIEEVHEANHAAREVADAAAGARRQIPGISRAPDEDRGEDDHGEDHEQNDHVDEIGEQPDSESGITRGRNRARGGVHVLRCSHASSSCTRELAGAVLRLGWECAAL